MSAPHNLPLIPWPEQQPDFRGGLFVLDSNTRIVVEPPWSRLGDYLVDRLETETKTRFSSGSIPKDASYILVRSVFPSPELGKEGYRMIIDPGRILIESSYLAGAFYGVQTLLQLVEISGGDSPGGRELPAIRVLDRPRYSWRGLMLDVARHFFQVEEIKQVIDWLAGYKMNRLHLHLTDDQGWRIEIKSWPNLAEVGGKGGHYSQEEYKDIVQYAADRFITVIPEIDVPDHTRAALNSYPELSCKRSLCLKKKAAYRFVTDSLGELSDITPGDYLHVGGDEARRIDPNEYVEFMQKVQEIVRQTGKRLIGWQEVGAIDLFPSSLLQFWQEKKGLPGLRSQQPIIMSPASRAYLDMKMDDAMPHGTTWAGLISASTAYNWDPDAVLPESTNPDVQGVEAALWTETVHSREDMETMMFPRFPGFAEIGWSPQAARNWEDYRRRLIEHIKWWDRQGISYYRTSELEN